ncbi:MAG TPA: hypothetical protein VFQ12_06970 [Thermoleophilaceae bacterium]|nr:hypothetical protein [Thermoleophilaceae bacterium]
MRAGERTGFVERADAPHRLAFWWSAAGEEATRVEIALDEVPEGTRLTVIESRPLALLDAVGSDLHLDLGVSPPGTPAMLVR